MRSALLYLLLVFLFTACVPDLTAINWYLRIEHTESCGDHGLYGGDYEILCPVDDAIWNGDSLVVKSAEVCYFVDAANYKDGQPLETFDCEAFEQKISIGKAYWAGGAGPPQY